MGYSEGRRLFEKQFITKNERTLTTADTVAVDVSIAQEMRADHERMEREAPSLKERLGDDIEKKMNFVKAQLKEYFVSRGVLVDYELKPVYLMPQTPENELSPGTQKKWVIQNNGF